MKVLSKSGDLIAVVGLVTPKLYVRGRRKMEYIHQLAAVIRDAMPLGGSGRPLSAEDAVKTIDKWWPFTDATKPVLIRRTVSESKDAKTGKITTQETMTSLDGNHRVEGAKDVGLSHVPAKIIECSDREAALAQLEANVSHGLFLDRNSRNEYIKALLADKDMKILQKDVAVIVHLTPASVNRILTGRQGTASASARKKQKKTTAKKRRAPRLSAGPFSTKAFFGEMVALSGDYDKASEQIDKAATGRTFKVSKAFKDFIDELKTSE